MPRRFRLERGALFARGRFGPARAEAEGGDTVPGEAAQVSRAIIDGAAAAETILGLSCSVLRDVVLATPSAAMARDPQIKAAIQARAAACRDEGNFSFGPGFWDRVALGPIGDAVAGVADLLKLSGLAAVVGNAVLAAAGGGLLWLGVRRIFVSGG